ncbi:hypothetical protein FWH13_03055 [Candidatus Saccharibacteria bacterium]|nr:hypothetical protein [Candidatus Saccharibacteria bacterium]
MALSEQDIEKISRTISSAMEDAIRALHRRYNKSKAGDRTLVEPHIDYDDHEALHAWCELADEGDTCLVKFPHGQIIEVAKFGDLLWALDDWCKDGKYHFTWDEAMAEFEDMEWRLPRASEWMALAEDNTIDRTTGGALGFFEDSFRTVKRGFTNTAGNLNFQSTYASWWTSSLSSGANAWYTRVGSTFVSPGTNGDNKANGFSVRCVYDLS